MKRIVLLGGSLGSGGAEHQSTILMDMLIEKGYDVSLITFTDVEDHYKISSRVKRIHIAKGKPNWWKLIKLQLCLLSIKADIVIAFSQRMSVLSLFMMLFRPKIRVISSERNFTVGSPDIFEKILINTKLYLRANYVVPNNYSQGNYLSERMPKLKNRIRVITNYTDITEYKSMPVPNNEVVRIGIFCRLEEQKNFHRFIEALWLLNKCSNYKYHVDWYGNHKFPTHEQTEYYNKGLRLINKYNLADYITIHDPVRNVNQLIPMFDVLCLPSLHEGFSNSISEYICSGRPVLCSDVSDNSIMVHHGVNGFLFNPLDVESIVQAFKTYFEISYDTRTLMGKNSRMIALNLFDRDKFINSYIQLFE